MGHKGDTDLTTKTSLRYEPADCPPGSEVLSEERRSFDLATLSIFLFRTSANNPSSEEFGQAVAIPSERLGVRSATSNITCNRSHLHLMLPAA